MIRCKVTFEEIMHGRGKETDVKKKHSDKSYATENGLCFLFVQLRANGSY